MKTPGDYALLWANGMKWPDVVAMIRAEMCCGEGCTGHGCDCCGPQDDTGDTIPRGELL